MSSENLYDVIDKACRKEGFKVHSFYGNLIEDGNWAIEMKLIPIKETPPALGISVSDGIGTEDKFGGA